MNENLNSWLWQELKSTPENLAFKANPRFGEHKALASSQPAVSASRNALLSSNLLPMGSKITCKLTTSFSWGYDSIREKSTQDSST